MTFVILSGGIDLSVGAIAGLCGMVAGFLLNRGLTIQTAGVTIYFNAWLVVVIALVAGMLLGAINGWLVARLRVAPFIATLGMLYVARGAAMLTSGGATFPNLGGTAALGNTGFPALGTGCVPRRSRAHLADGRARGRRHVPRDWYALRPAGLRHRRQRAGGLARRRPCSARSSSASM